MNALLGARIRQLRDQRVYSQEQVAQRLGCSRQKLARMEKGVIDIPYVMICQIAKILAVSEQDITSAVNDQLREQVMYRSEGQNSLQEPLAFFRQMLDTFYAHHRLYEQTRSIESDD